MILPSIDDLIRADFEAYRNVCFDWLLISTGVVAVGLLFELPEIWHDSVDAVAEIRHTCKPTLGISPLVKLLVSVGWFLIVVGVVGEFVATALCPKLTGLCKPLMKRC